MGADCNGWIKSPPELNRLKLMNSVSPPENENMECGRTIGLISIRYGSFKSVFKANTEIWRLSSSGCANPTVRKENRTAKKRGNLHFILIEFRWSFRFYRSHIYRHNSNRNWTLEALLFIHWKFELSVGNTPALSNFRWTYLDRLAIRFGVSVYHWRSCFSNI